MTTLAPGLYEARVESVVLDADEKAVVIGAVADVLGFGVKFRLLQQARRNVAETAEFGGIDPRMSEAAHYLDQWSRGIGERWNKFRQAASRAGFTMKPTLEITVDKVEFRIYSDQANMSPSVCLWSDGTPVNIEGVLKQFSFDHRVFLKLNEAVLSALSSMERALRDKLDVIGKLPDLYGPDALELKLEREENVQEKKTRDVTF